MKKSYGVLVLFLLAFVLFGCGGGGGSSPTPPQHAPSISNLSYSPQTAIQGEGGGAVTINGSFDFIDTDGNVTGYTILIYQSGVLIETLTGTVDASGITAGYLNWVVTGADTTSPANYTFEIFITDSTSLKSNKLTGTFDVT